MIVDIVYLIFEALTLSNGLMDVYKSKKKTLYISLMLVVYECFVLKRMFYVDFKLFELIYVLGLFIGFILWKYYLKDRVNQYSFHIRAINIVFMYVYCMYKGSLIVLYNKSYILLEILVVCKLVMLMTSLSIKPIVVSDEVEIHTQKQRNIIICMIVVLMIIFVLLFESILKRMFNVETILIVVLWLCVEIFLVLYLYSETKRQIQDQLEMHKKMMQLQYLKEYVDKTNRLYDTMLYKEHRMMHVLRKIKYDVTNKETLNFIDDEIQKISSRNFICNTGNYEFDDAFSFKINDLRLKDYDVKVMILMPRVERSQFNDKKVILDVVGFLDEVACNCIDLSIDLRLEEMNNKVVIQAIIKNHNDIKPIENVSVISEGEYIVYKKFI